MDQPWQEIWYKSKDWIRDGLGMSNDVMHVHFGLTDFIFFALLFHKVRYGLLFSWLLLAAFQTVNNFLTRGCG